MNCNPHDIVRVCEKPPGGIRTVTIIVPSDLESEPVQYCVPNIADLVLVDGAVAYSLEIDQFSGRLVDKQNTSNRAGDTFDYSLTFTIRKVRLDVEWLRGKLANRRMHVIVTYATGLQRYLPNMRPVSESDSGDKIGSRNQYTFNFSTSLERPAPTIDSSISGGTGTIIPPAPPGLTVATAIAAPGGTVSIGAETLVHAIVILPTSLPNTVTIGTSAGGDQVMSEEEIAAGQIWHHSHLQYFPTPGSLYFTVSENCSVIIYLR